MLDKKTLRAQFAKEWEKHYKLDALVSNGFERYECKKCKKHFWSRKENEFCGDPACIGYQFIGKTPVKTKLTYMETWKKIESYFKKHDHGIIKPYPTVARWRDDLYFTIASINDFQPYVVNGELEPPHNPLLVPQNCIRFSDISNVGVTGRHYTNFVMIGQHAFNKSNLFYWKNEAVQHDIGYMADLGIPLDEVVFVEDVWMGGGNFGPSMEYFVGGLELGNCVFMQYEVRPDGSTRELKTKVIDMGAGLSRLAWITDGGPTSYEVVFHGVIDKMKKQAGVDIDRKLFMDYAKLSGSLNDEDVEDLQKEKDIISKKLGIPKEELFKTLAPLQALYATADHLLTLQFTTHDGMLPGNSGGGYNLRMIMRRVFGFEDEFGFKFDYGDIFEGHAKHLKYLSPELEEIVDTTVEVVNEEKRKYNATKEKARGKIASLVKGGKVTEQNLYTLYKSDGIPPEFVAEEAKRQNLELKVPENFYSKVRDEDITTETQKKLQLPDLPKTTPLYYKREPNFKGKVLFILNSLVILDQTGFYPEGGGQVGDIGELNGTRVLAVTKQDGIIMHKVQDISKFKVGDEVAGKIDLERRKDITRHHTCAHLVTAACRKVLGNHAWQGGSQKDEEKGHMDITHFRRITDEELEKIEQQVNDWVMQDLPVKVETLPRNEAEKRYGFTLYQGGAVPGKEIRVVSIGDVDHEACGGTHETLRTTGEIGVFKIVKREGVKDGIERITFKCGKPAIKYIQEREKLLKTAAGVVSVQESELPKTIERFFGEWKSQQKRIESLTGELVSLEVADIKAKKTRFKILDSDKDVLLKIATEIAKSGGDICLVNREKDLVCGSSKDASELLNKVIAKLGGKGGGRGTLAAGKVERVENVNL